MTKQQIDNRIAQLELELQNGGQPLVIMHEITLLRRWKRKFTKA